MLVVSYGLGPLNFQAPLSSLGLRLDTGRTPGHLVYTALAFGGSIGFIVAYAAVLDAAGLENLQPDQGITEDAILGGAGVAASVLMIVVIGPFTEEVFFRGFIFPALRTRLGFGLGAGGQRGDFRRLSRRPKGDAAYIRNRRDAGLALSPDRFHLAAPGRPRSPKRPGPRRFAVASERRGVM